MGWLASLTLEDEVSEYEDVFLHESMGLPLHSDVDFTIELHLGTSPISMTTHRMEPVELHELKVQLQEFIDIGFIRLSTSQTELVDQSVIQDTFLISRLWARVLFDFGASHSFIATSCVKDLGLEVETMEKSLHVSSPLGTRVSVDQICRDCELEISGILLTMDLRVMNMLEFDVILGMD